MTYYKFTITGTVQGVGFRPFVYNACTQAGLVGYVQNTGSGVDIVINDKNALESLLQSPPPQARITDIRIEKINADYTDFRIRESVGSGFSEIPPDFNLCEDCREELFDHKNRRYNYFFTTCTNCGPRFTIAQKSPYDRATTSMQTFPMCDTCQAEYQNPEDRRYHAQTIACHACGPTLSLYRHDTCVENDSLAAIRKTITLLREGALVAIKGVGGFHVVCNTHPQTIRTLKHLTGRTDKPFALMCRDITMVRDIAHVSPQEENLLLSQERPIVILSQKDHSPEISELDSVGVMLPYTALHELLFSYYDAPLVMTSSNAAGAPITRERAEQFTEYILDHTRTITNSVDDSLLKVVAETPLLIRRSRGFVPQSIDVDAAEKKQILALGAEVNSAFALYKDGRITPSQYLGNTAHPLTLEHYKKTLTDFLTYTDTQPDILIADAHPAYNISLYAEELAQQWNIPLIRVQHHRAHAASVAAEHNLSETTAIVCDGMGYGDDGTLWGGEIFVGDERVGHLEEQKLLGGDSATHNPRKILFSILKNFMTTEEINLFFKKHFTASFDAETLQLLHKQWDEDFNAPLTSSCGRILDAASALLDLCEKQTYDGRAAMLLESHSTKPYSLPPVIKNNILMTTPLFAHLVKNFGKDKNRLAATVQHYLAEGLYTIANQYDNPITFSGGCAYNRIMSEYMISKGVLLNKKIPSGDGGISFGQVAHYLKD